MTTGRDRALEMLRETAQAAANASLGDSNDEEIELLQDALGQALALLGIEYPEAREAGE